MQLVTSFILVHPQLVGFVGFIVFSHLRLKSYLHIFQQEEYDSARFVRWLIRDIAIDRSMSAVALAAAIASFLMPTASIFLSLLICAAFFGQVWREQSHQRKAKKPLVMTSRASRILEVAWTTSGVVGLFLALRLSTPLVWVLAIQICPLLLLASNVALSPVEARVKSKFWNEAHAKLSELQPFVIGITGSYGKTSTKHILGHLLQQLGSTLITPGSVNTPMGISRVIREQLRESHKYFVVEMGAYGVGSIANLCELTPPKLGVITAIGSAHLERFGALETTARAKMELAHATITNHGRVIINSQIQSIPFVDKYISAAPEPFITCDSSKGDFVYSNVDQTREGLRFRLTWKEQAFDLSVPLFGMHQVMNISLAFAAAISLGADPKRLVAALRTVPQISHRLELRRSPHGGVVIDDGYNSNPEGFESALRLLGTLRVPGGKTYLITPGMAELGVQHVEKHFSIGKLAAEIVDTTFVVSSWRIPSFLEGWRAGLGSPDHLISSESFAEAYERVMSTFKKDDVLLIENDLPDLYESKLAL